MATWFLFWILTIHLNFFSVKGVRGSLSHSRKRFDTKRAVFSQKIIPNNSKVMSNSDLIRQNRQNSPIVVVFQSFLQKKVFSFKSKCSIIDIFYLIIINSKILDINQNPPVNNYSILTFIQIMKSSFKIPKITIQVKFCIRFSILIACSGLGEKLCSKVPTCMLTEHCTINWFNKIFPPTVFPHLVSTLE